MTAQSRPTTPDRSFPFGFPLAGSADPASTLVSDPSASGRGTNTPPRTSSDSSRIHASTLLRIKEKLAKRDLHILELVNEHRYLTTHQLTRFTFTEHASNDSAARSCRYVLSRLERLGLLRPLSRRIGGGQAGSAVRVWQLSPAAARLLRDDGATYRVHQPSPRLLAHCLAVADIHLVLRSLATDDRQVTVHTEPASWRRYAGLGGEARWLQPDLAAVVTSQDFEDRWFVEVDLGTESMPTLLRKSGAYEAYRTSGQEQAQHGVFPLVLWVFTSAERAERLQQAVLRSPRLTPELFRFALPAGVSELVAAGGAP